MDLHTDFRETRLLQAVSLAKAFQIQCDKLRTSLSRLEDLIEPSRGASTNLIWISKIADLLLTFDIAATSLEFTHISLPWNAEPVNFDTTSESEMAESEHPFLNLVEYLRTPGVLERSDARFKASLVKVTHTLMRNLKDPRRMWWKGIESTFGVDRVPGMIFGGLETDSFVQSARLMNAAPLVLLQLLALEDELGAPGAESWTSELRAELEAEVSEVRKPQWEMESLLGLQRLVSEVRKGHKEWKTQQKPA
ncbi:hypothetical protein AC579_2139 [Pseudocercospora musae]|uniref:Uncharacterized protein n=1 Tax=Pseudocercospora musae TaxID=113226 RepID=A0A139I3H2_9PEZI|nr:hypothetical protein AC579_2139 [Pseudocercospora musae]